MGKKLNAHRRHRERVLELLVQIHKYWFLTTALELVRELLVLAFNYCFPLRTPPLERLRPSLRAPMATQIPSGLRPVGSCSPG